MPLRAHRASSFVITKPREFQACLSLRNTVRVTREQARALRRVRTEVVEMRTRFCMVSLAILRHLEEAMKSANRSVRM